MENKEILKELRSIMGLNRREFAEYFCIPYRTVQEWELAHRNMPDYLLRLMLYSEKLRSCGVRINFIVPVKMFLLFKMNSGKIS